VSVNDRRVVAARHEGRTEWLAFSDRICKNEHVRRELRGRQDGVCAVCGHELGSSLVVHHVDYDHECGLAHLGVRWTRLGTRRAPRLQLFDRVDALAQLWRICPTGDTDAPPAGHSAQAFGHVSVTPR
jgi:5-methylcytosine-specific restriction endonuclease McrA